MRTFDEAVSRARWALLLVAVLTGSANVACPLDCKPSDGYDEIVLLDLPPLVISGNGGMSASVSTGGQAGIGGPGATSGPPPSSCGATAAGCTPGQPCPAACDCVTAREARFGRQPYLSGRAVDRCILAKGGGAPAVEIWSHEEVICE